MVHLTKIRAKNPPKGGSHICGLKKKMVPFLKVLEVETKKIGGNAFDTELPPMFAVKVGEKRNGSIFQAGVFL